MSWAEAQKISGLSDDELYDLKKLTGTVNKLITQESSSIRFVNEDGKIEVGFEFFRRLMIVYVLGTLDECMFTYEGLPVGKEIARIYYRNTEWKNAVEKAKKKQTTLKRNLRFSTRAINSKIDNN